MKTPTRLTASEQRKYLGLMAAYFLLATPAIADAQTAFLNGLLTWVQGNVITTLGTLAIIVVGLVLLSMRASFVTILAVCAGIWVIFNATTLAGLLKQ
jgi:type IV secretory pathway VirB2 component (pilin)